MDERVAGVSAPGPRASVLSSKRQMGDARVVLDVGAGAGSYEPVVHR